MTNKEPYFVIRSSDGDTTVFEYNKEDLIADLEAGEFGNEGEKILEHIPTDDTNFWHEGSVLIIKGTIVVPKAVKHIIKFEIE